MCKQLWDRFLPPSAQGGKTWQVVPPGGEFSFDWSPSDGYVNIETKTPQKTLGPVKGSKSLRALSHFEPFGHWQTSF